ncbi:MAG: holo-ACP synthase [Clostridiales bacterium]|jgi:holo-[acyl-carrier protein] synthase|nr:holo-ACP synthase [Clostridiales bacterium]
MVGIDLTEIARIERAASSERFCRRVFTDAERRYCEDTGGRAETLAGMFAAKEAAAKALGTGFSGFSLRDIEVLHDKNGKPRLAVYRGAAALLNGRRIEVSITHTGGLAAAVCLIV